MIGDLATWQRLMEPAMAELRAAAASSGTVAEIARLRKLYPSPLVAAAIDLAEARRRAQSKFGPEVVARLIADPAGVEMASSAAVSRHKVARFAAAAGNGAQIADLCCGIGGDAMALRAAGLQVLGVDADEVRAWMCAANASCQSRSARVEDPGAWNTPWFHLDPSRRTEGGKRIFTLADLSPGPEVWRGVIDRAKSCAAGNAFGGAIKLGPGVNPAEVLEAIGTSLPVEIEFISENRRMSQAVAWVGKLAGTASVRATAIRGDQVMSIAGEPAEPEVGQLSAFLIEADDAIERASLLGSLAQSIGASAICRGLGLLTADHPPADEWATSFAILASMPWNERRIHAWLREHDGGIVEVKTRGGAVEPDALQLRLRGRGGTVYTLFVLRIGRAMEAFITRRVVPGQSA